MSRTGAKHVAVKAAVGPAEHSKTKKAAKRRPVKRRIFGQSRLADLVAATCWYNNKLLVTELGALKRAFYLDDGSVLCDSDLPNGYLYRVEILRVPLVAKESIGVRT